MTQIALVSENRPGVEVVAGHLAKVCLAIDALRWDLGFDPELCHAAAALLESISDSCASSLPRLATEARLLLLQLRLFQGGDASLTDLLESVADDLAQAESRIERMRILKLTYWGNLSLRNAGSSNYIRPLLSVSASIGWIAFAASCWFIRRLDHIYQRGGHETVLAGDGWLKQHRSRRRELRGLTLFAEKILLLLCSLPLYVYFRYFAVT